MYRKLFLLAALMLMAGALFSQDTIYRIDRSYERCKVTEVSREEIRYKKTSHLDGPVYVISTKEVWKIVYADGDTDIFNTPGFMANAIPLRPWAVGLNGFDLMFGVITVVPEHRFRSGNVSLRFPFSVGIRTLKGDNVSSYVELYYYSSSKLYSAAIELLAFPAGRMKKWNFFMGARLEYGQVQTMRNVLNPFPPPNYTYQLYKEPFYGLGILNGFQYRPSDRVELALDAALGMLMNEENNYEMPMFRFGITMSYCIGPLPPVKQN
ncbi:MAG TPA: hypothetical protein VI731_02265 [Bacteroidia bacterium]|nr:hypothetical protein [Bacteroidia bacterium]